MRYIVSVVKSREPVMVLLLFRKDLEIIGVSASMVAVVGKFFLKPNCDGAKKLFVSNFVINWFFKVVSNILPNSGVTEIGFDGNLIIIYASFFVN